jgi:hypothetical protein
LFIHQLVDFAAPLASWLRLKTADRAVTTWTQRTSTMCRLASRIGIDRVARIIRTLEIVFGDTSLWPRARGVRRLNGAPHTPNIAWPRNICCWEYRQPIMVFCCEEEYDLTRRKGTAPR